MLEDRTLLDATPEAMVTGMFEGLLRQPVPEDVQAHWADAFRRGIQPAALAHELVAGPEFRTDLLQSEYVRLLDRVPNADEVAFWRNAPLADFQAAALASDEYARHNGAFANADFLDAAYHDLLHRDPDPVATTAFLGALGAGMTRQAAAHALASSPEAQMHRLDGFYQQLLHRPIDGGGYVFWSEAMTRGATPEYVVPFLLTSQEFADALSAGPDPDDGRDGSMPLRARATSFRAVAGEAFGGPVAGFTDADGLETDGAYTATIEWGDGTRSPGRVGGRLAIGKLSDKGSNVFGGHTYERVGNYTILITIADGEGHSATARTVVSVRNRRDDLYPAGYNAGPDKAHLPPGSIVPSTPPATKAGGEYADVVTTEVSGGIACNTEIVATTLGIAGASAGNVSGAAVRYFDGVVSLPMNDLGGAGYGRAWGHTRTWTNDHSYVSNAANGLGFAIQQQPALLARLGQAALLTGGNNARVFDLDGGSYVERFYLPDQLAYDTPTQTYTFTDSTGVEYEFVTAGAASSIKQFDRVTNPGGDVIEVVSRFANGAPEEVQRSAVVGGQTVTESLLYEQVPFDPLGRYAGVTLRRQVGSGAWETVREAEYEYHDGLDGPNGALKRAVIKDASGNVLDTWYYRYYALGESNGYEGALKFVFSPQSYAKLAAAFTDPTTATDAEVAPYANNYLEYDEQQRVTKHTMQGTGCSSCDGGQGTYTYVYALPSTNSDGYNSWKYKTVETLPDGSTNTVYMNYGGQVMLTVFTEAGTSQEWLTYHQYDGDGREVLRAYPSAVSGYDETKADLLNATGGNYQHLRDAAGLVMTTEYATSTTATSSTAGDVEGYRQSVALRRGEQGTSVPQQAWTYIEHTGGGATVYPVAASTVYRNADGTGAQTTTFAYTWYTDSTRIESTTVTHPTVTAAQNGPGTADIEVSVRDTYGRVTWTMDGGGFITYIEYDQATGAETKTIQDVDTTQTSTFTGLPSGWSTPTGGGLHLTTTMEIDHFGRTTKLTDPNGNVTYTVYNDANYETRVYPGWQSATNTTTGPTRVYRQDRGSSTGYREMLTMSATPAVSGGRPTGTEAIGSLQTLSRTYVNSGGQTVREDRYFNLTGLTYSTATYLGTENTHYYATHYGYDHRGRRDRVQSPTGTITRAVYDGLSRMVSTWVGLDDTPTSGPEWTPTNTAGTDLVKVRENAYDGGGVGDGNLTQMTQFPGGAESPRVTVQAYDWRNRLVASKGGVQASEVTDVQRPITYVELDNLGQVTAQEQYDGDGVTIVDANSDGAPDKPSAGLLRARSTSAFDERGRSYRESMYSVDPTNGTVSGNALTTNVWFDHRGNDIKTNPPGGQVIKRLFDGAGRVVKTYSSDGLDDTSWSDADDVSGDHVLTQIEHQYDARGNVILVITKDRFHDETATGELGSPGVAPKARVSFEASYYDSSDRLVGRADVGTNGGTTYSRPATLPARSDLTRVVSYTYGIAVWVETTTDPRGIALQTDHDSLGRQVKYVEAYVDGIPSSGDDKTLEFTYDGADHILTYQATLPGGGVQVTQYVYAASTATGSGVNSNDVLTAVKYPDKMTGLASSSEQEVSTVNALGERLTYTDRNGTVHTYGRDVLGRELFDAVTSLGAGVDGQVRRLQQSFDSAGRRYQITSYDAASGGNVVNQVQQGYNGLGQLVVEYQEHSGAVNTSTTPKVQYAYSEMSGGANHSRMTALIYPNGRAVNQVYATGLDDRISRLSALADTSATLEEYTYLGLGTIVRRAHPQPGVDMTYVKLSGEASGDAGDQYVGLDRFGQIVDVRWQRTSDNTYTDRFRYGYDHAGNRMYSENVLQAALSELYHPNGSTAGLDGFGRMTEFRQGPLSDSNSDGVPDQVSTPSITQTWEMDAVGNFDSVTTNGAAEARSTNEQNQIVSVGSVGLAWSANGYLVTDAAGRSLTYDAWGRRVESRLGSTVIEGLTYDALSRRIVESSDGTRNLYYSTRWQVLEERVAGTVDVQYAWGSYVDGMILRDRGSERLYAQLDGQHNTTALISASGSVVERFAYTPYGDVVFMNAAWEMASASESEWNYLHHGGRYSEMTGLYHFRHRDYSPELAIWLQPDPLVYTDGPNDYLALRNNPASLIDPSGTKSKNPCLAHAADGWKLRTMPRDTPRDGEKVKTETWTFDPGGLQQSTRTVTRTWTLEFEWVSPSDFAPYPSNECGAGVEGEWSVYFESAHSLQIGGAAGKKGWEVFVSYTFTGTKGGANTRQAKVDGEEGKEFMLLGLLERFTLGYVDSWVGAGPINRPPRGWPTRTRVVEGTYYTGKMNFAVCERDCIDC